MKATGADALAAAAQRILEHARHTRYESRPVIDAKTGTYEVDGAAFFALLLESVSPEHLALIPKEASERYPRAFEVFDFLHGESAHGWRHVESLAQAERGDVIVWTPAKAAAGHDAGHVLVVAKAPELHDKATHVWSVHAYDSSPSAHHDDSRQHGAKFRAGVGEGGVRFKVDASGAPVAFQLGPHADFHTGRIVVARLHELPSAKKRTTPHNDRDHNHAHDEARHSAPPPSPGPGAAHSVERGAVANEVLKRGEYAITTYVIAAADAMLLPPAVLAYWGPGQTVPASVGQGSASYTLAGGVVFRHC